MPFPAAIRRFSLLSLLLFVTLVCVTIGWVIDRARGPEVWYLHLYSTRYDIRYPAEYPRHPWPKKNECIATISVSPGVEFYANLPNHYEPEMLFEGVVTKRPNGFDGSFTISVQDVGESLRHEQTATAPMEVPVSIGQDFSFVISRSATPDAEDEERSYGK